MKKNVLIIITRLYGGGAERVASNLSIELSKIFNVTTVVFDGNKQTYPHKGEIIDLKLQPNRNIFIKLFNTINRIVKIRKIKKGKDINCSISLLDGPNIANIFSRRNDKVITSIRNIRSFARKDKFLKSAISTFFITRLADKVVSVSELVREDLIKNYGVKPENIISIYNSCDPVQLLKNPYKPEDINRHSLSKDTFNFVTMGRMTIQKGHWHLIRAFKKAKKQIPNARLYIIGDGMFFKKLVSITKDLGIEESVIFTGYLKNPHQLIKKCDVFVFTSVFEGLGNAILEAMACGKPVISTDCDAGPREILAPDTDIWGKTKIIEYSKYGVLVPIFDYNNFNSSEDLNKEEDVLADAMIAFGNDRGLIEKYSKQSLKRIEHFSKDNITAEWDKLINDLLGN